MVIIVINYYSCPDLLKINYMTGKGLYIINQNMMMIHLEVYILNSVLLTIKLLQ